MPISHPSSQGSGIYGEEEAERLSEPEAVNGFEGTVFPYTESNVNSDTMTDLHKLKPDKNPIMEATGGHIVPARIKKVFVIYKCWEKKIQLSSMQ